MKKFDLIFITVTLLLLGVIASLFRYEKSLRLPGFSDQTVLAISTEKNSSGQVLAYDKTNDTKIYLTDPNLTVDQFVIDTRRSTSQLFYTSRSNLNTSIDQSLSLDRLDLKTGKKRAVKLPPDFWLLQLFPRVINDKLFVYGGKDSDRSWWYYSLKQKHWKPFYADIPWQQIQMSERTQLAVGVNPYDNFGYGIFSLIENPDSINLIGNFSLSFGFSPNGQQMLFQQKPERDVFANTSYLSVFRADGTSNDFFVAGDFQVPLAVWASDNRIYLVKRWTDGSEALVLLDIDTAEEQEIWHSSETEIQNLRFQDDHLWLTKQVLITDENGEPNWKHETLNYDASKSYFDTWPVEGITPYDYK
jgi:hypothetical protein